MGITIDNYPLYGGAVDISGVYTYVRDINTTKNADNNYELNFNAIYELDVSGKSQRVDTKGYIDTSSNVYTDLWTDAYDALKASLDNLNITYVNS